MNNLHSHIYLLVFLVVCLIISAYTEKFGKFSILLFSILIGTTIVDLYMDMYKSENFDDAIKESPTNLEYPSGAYHIAQPSKESTELSVNNRGNYDNALQKPYGNYLSSSRMEDNEFSQIYDQLNGSSGGLYTQLNEESRANEKAIEDGLVDDDPIPLFAKMPNFTEGDIDFMGAYNYDRDDKSGGIGDNGMMRMELRRQHRFKENNAYNFRRADARRVGWIYEDDFQRTENCNWWEVDQMTQLREK